MPGEERNGGIPSTTGGVLPKDGHDAAGWRTGIPFRKKGPKEKERKIHSDLGRTGGGLHNKQDVHHIKNEKGNWGGSRIFISGTKNQKGQRKIGDNLVRVGGGIQGILRDEIEKREKEGAR